MRRLRVRLLACAITLAVAGLTAAPWLSAAKSPRPAADAPVSAESRGGMVATSHPLATDVGVRILREGGNAVDAAVAVAFALSVVEPWNTGAGGGSFLLVRMQDGRAAAIDGRETAPLGVSRDMYLDEKGNPTDDSRTGPRAVGVPGTVAALALARDRFGTRPWKDLIAPAVTLARDGFPVGERMSAAIFRSAPRLGGFAEWSRLFLVDGRPPGVSHRLAQPDLARSYTRLAEEGPAALYGGALGKAVADDVQAQGGLLTLEDLRGYKPVVRAPLEGSYRGTLVLAFPPPAGGAVVIETLHLLERFDLAKLGAGSPETIHLVVEALKLSFADRAAYLGDPDVVKVPTAGLVSKAYASRRGRTIRTDRASPVAGGGDPFREEGTNTTHFSIVDAAGNAVSATQSINLPLGSGIVAKGTGIVLNDELDDFSAKPGSPNAYGLVGAEANAIVPGKRPLSSMSPTILVRWDSPLLVVGSPGGPRIISAVLETILNVVDFGMTPKRAVAVRRFHHQWKPDVLAVEEGTSPEVIAALEKRGHRVREVRPWSSVQAISVDPEKGIRRGASDPRTGGKAAGE
jgi:gamma-glutamyltranspeptidase/glutathione hydrolase